MKLFIVFVSVFLSLVCIFGVVTRIMPGDSVLDESSLHLEDILKPEDSSQRLEDFSSLEPSVGETPEITGNESFVAICDSFHSSGGPSDITYSKMSQGGVFKIVAYPCLESNCKSDIFSFEPTLKLTLPGSGYNPVTFNLGEYETLSQEEAERGAYFSTVFALPPLSGYRYSDLSGVGMLCDIVIYNAQ